MFRYLRNSGLRQKIMITSLICLILPFAFVVYVSSVFTNNLIKDQAVTNASESLKFVKSQWMNTMQGLFSIANHLEFDGMITPYLKSANYTGIPYAASINVTDRIGSLTHDKSGVFVTVLTPDKRFYTNYLLDRNFTPLQFYDEAWFKNLNDLPAYEMEWLGVHSNYVTQEQARNPFIITFARTLRTYIAKPYAYIVISISEKKISSLFSSYEEQNIMLLDDTGTILSAKTGVGEHFQHYEQLKAPKDKHTITIDGVSYLYVMENLPFENWSLLSLMPYSEAISEANRIHWNNFIWQIGFFLLFIIILIYLLRQFTQPLISLSQVAASIESDHLSIRSGIRGTSEVGKLGKSFDKMLDRVEEMVEQITQEQEQKRKAELSMLQAQIHPHFLFNILNSIRMRILLSGDRESADLLSSLSKLLRMTIQKQDRMVSFQEEIKITEEYMILMKSTLKEPFQYTTELSSDTLNVSVPRFILQPIIENAIIHGVNKGSGHLEIQSSIVDTFLVIIIRDDGIGMKKEQLDELRDNMFNQSTQSGGLERQGMSGIGLDNVYNRLLLIYGKECGINVESVSGEGTTVSIHIPSEGWGNHD